MSNKELQRITRRHFIKTAGLAGVGLGLAACGVKPETDGSDPVPTGRSTETPPTLGVEATTSSEHLVGPQESRPVKINENAKVAEQKATKAQESLQRIDTNVRVQHVLEGYSVTVNGETYQGVLILGSYTTHIENQDVHIPLEMPAVIDPKGQTRLVLPAPRSATAQALFEVKPIPDVRGSEVHGFNNEHLKIDGFATGLFEPVSDGSGNSRWVVMTLDGDIVFNRHDGTKLASPAQIEPILDSEWEPDMGDEETYKKYDKWRKLPWSVRGGTLAETNPTKHGLGQDVVVSSATRLNIFRNNAENNVDVEKADSVTLVVAESTPTPVPTADPGQGDRVIDKKVYLSRTGVNPVELQVQLTEEGTIWRTEDGVVQLRRENGTTFYKEGERELRIAGEAPLPEAIDIPPYTPVERVAPETVFPERYNAEHTILHEFKGTGEYEGIDLPIYTGIAHMSHVRDIEIKDNVVEVLGKSYLIACWGRYSEIMRNSDVTFEDYLDLVRQNRGQVTYSYYDANGDLTHTRIDPRDGVALLVTYGEDGLNFETNPKVRNSRKDADLSITENKQPVIVMGANQLLDESLKSGTAIGRSPDLVHSYTVFNQYVNGLQFLGYADSHMLNLKGNHEGGISSAVVNKINQMVQQEYDILRAEDWNGITKLKAIQQGKADELYFIVVNNNS